MNRFLLTEDALLEPWRLVTCHAVHWGWAHASRDAIAMAIPFLLVDRKRRLAIVLLFLSPLLSLALLPVLQGGAYGGLSGLASAAWAYAGATLLGKGERRGAGLALLSLLTGKLLVESAAGGAYPGLNEGWQSLAEAHVYGAILGLIAGMSDVAMAPDASAGRRLITSNSGPGGDPPPRG